MPSLETYHEDLSKQELKVWSPKVAEAQQFSEDHMDDSLSNRALTKGLPPTNLSYAEFFGMRVRTLSYLHLKNDDKVYDLFLPGRTLQVLLDKDVGRGSDADDESFRVKGKGKGKGKKGKGKEKSKGKDKGKGKFNPTLVHPDNIDPLKLVWKPRRGGLVPVKGAGRDNYRALRSETLHGWLHSIEHQRVLDEGGDVESIQINLEDYALLDLNPVAKKLKDPPKRQREQMEDPETKRVRKGGPPAIPPTWRNKHPSELVMSFASPEVRDGCILVVLQASSQLPAFGRYCIPLPGEIREDRVSDNPMGNEYLWSPITNPFWEPCRKKNKLQYGMAASYSVCSLYV